MKKIFKKMRFILICFSWIVICLHFFKIQVTAEQLPYFPLNENDQYVYKDREGPETDIVTITVKNVKHIKGGTEFDFLFHGKYNDRIQTSRLTSKGLLFCRNRHLVGEVPLKVIREFSPPILMLPYKLKKNVSFNTTECIYDYDRKLIDKEEVDAEVDFVGSEKVEVEAGEFQCLHFFVRLNSKDQAGNSKHMHTYNFWIAQGLGYVKAIHVYTPFIYITYIKPEDKTIMNRYNGSFVEVLELKKATIGGKTIKR